MRSLVLSLFGALVCLSPAVAQEDVWVPDLPLTHDTGTSARAMGMGGAYLAISDDASALRANPAGLARIGRIEFGASLVDRTLDLKTVDQGDPSNADLAKSRIAALSFVYPFPTYRGSMVLAVGYFVPHVLDRNYVRAGGNRQEQLFEEGAVAEWSAGIAVDMSPTLSVGVRATRIYGSRFQDWVFQNADYDVHEISDLEISGFTASVGALARVAPWAQLGLVLDLPRWLRNEATFDDFITTEDMTLPFSVGAGLAASLQRLLIAGDIRMTDWTQIDYEGPLRYTDASGNRQLAYRRTWNLHVGAEYLVDLGNTVPIRLRAGLAHEPVPYRVVFEDITEEGDPVYSKGRFSPDRSYFTIGGGVLLAESLTLDVAYASGSFERKGETLTEQEEERRLLITASFRLN